MKSSNDVPNETSYNPTSVDSTISESQSSANSSNTFYGRYFNTTSILNSVTKITGNFTDMFHEALKTPPESHESAENSTTSNSNRGNTTYAMQMTYRTNRSLMTTKSENFAARTKDNQEQRKDRFIDRTLEASSDNDHKKHSTTCSTNAENVAGGSCMRNEADTQSIETAEQRGADDTEQSSIFPTGAKNYVSNKDKSWDAPEPARAQNIETTDLWGAYDTEQSSTFATGAKNEVDNQDKSWDPPEPARAQNIEENSISVKRSLIEELPDEASFPKEGKTSKETFGRNLQDYEIDDHEGEKMYADVPQTNCLQHSSPSNEADIIQNMLATYTREKNVAVALGILNHYHSPGTDSIPGKVTGITKDVNTSNTDSTCTFHNNAHSKTTLDLKGSTLTNSELDRNKYLIEQIKSLNSEIFDVQQISDDYKTLYQEQTKLNNKIRTAVLSLYWDLGEMQGLSTSNPFWSVSSGQKKPEEDTTLNNVRTFCKYVKLLHGNQENQEAAIDIKTRENQRLQTLLSEANKEISNWENKFEEKRRKQTNVIKDQDKQIVELKKWCEIMEIQHAKKILQANRCIEKLKTDYEVQLKNQCSISEDLENHKEKLLKENRVLKQSLDQSRTELQNMKEKLEGLELQRKTTLEICIRLEGDLTKIKKVVRDQANSLTKENGNFHKSLNAISKKIISYSSKISVDDIKRQTEDMVIKQALKKIHGILNDAKKYEHQISTFQGNNEDKTYLDIKEMLIRAVERLDTIESQKKQEIQFNRKDAIDYVKRLQDQLERRVHGPK